MKKTNNIIQKHRELIVYIVFGVLTTLVNFVAFGMFNIVLGKKMYLISNAIAWIISVLFAYITNKLFVFRSKSFAAAVLAKEFSEFLVARVFSFAVEEFGMWLFVDALGFGKYSLDILFVTISGQFIAKIFLAVIVVIMNYFFSKFIIFARKK
ncbi:MAG: GtrA family protein [Ruminococcaceae bacterium]|nr:GtrA family protein [Oscillospiraceae bacterium]